MRFSLLRTALAGSVLVIPLQVAPQPLFAACTAAESASSRPVVSIPEIVARLHADRPTYLFVGERHRVGPVKRFVVDLGNALVDAGLDVGIYVEGFRTDCAPTDGACRSLARTFRAWAFFNLLREARAPVHPIAPPEVTDRTRRMAERIQAGPEAIRIVLVGNTHVVHAGDPDAELWIFGGGMRYPDPGDLVEAFPRERSLTIALREGDPPPNLPYALVPDGCEADYALFTHFGPEY